MISIINDFHNKNNDSLFESGDYRFWLSKKLYEKVDLPSLVIKSSDHVKNLILIQLESFSNEFIQNNLISPNLNNFSKMYEFIAPIYSEPYSTWSTAATILLQTGIPQIIPDTDWSIRGKANIDYMSKIKGIPDILLSYGYKLEFATRGSASIMGFDAWVRSRNYTRILTAKDDNVLYSFFTDGYLEKMDKDIRFSNFNSHYLVYIVNDETHSDYRKPKWCNFQFPHIEQKQKCFYCIDYLIGKLVRKFIDLKMYEHTLLVIYPDHVPFARKQFGIEPKELFILFPGMKKIDNKFKINGEITYYDFGPTIMDLLGIKKYIPDFPFGRSIYDIKSNKNNKSLKHNKPDNNDLSIIYKFLHFERGEKVKAKYNISQPFKCYRENTKSFYYSTSPCNRTKVL